MEGFCTGGKTESDKRMSQWISTATQVDAEANAHSLATANGLPVQKSSISELWRGHFSALDRIALLKDDWDGDGAVAPSPELVDSARDLLHDLQGFARFQLLRASRQGRTEPSLSEWQNGMNYFEIEVYVPLTVWSGCWHCLGKSRFME